MAYSSHMAAALSGSTIRQLRAWRQECGSGPLLKPELASRPAFYSFHDVLALRAFARLRHGVSLQKIRGALGSLKGIGEVERLPCYSLATEGDSVVLVYEDHHVTGSVEQSDRRVIVTMAEVLREFALRPGVVVPHLLRPKHHVCVDPETQGGQPVITGTRVPFDIVAELVKEGVAPEEIANYFPGVTAGAARDAVSFALYVDSYSTGPRAA